MIKFENIPEVICNYVRQAEEADGYINLELVRRVVHQILDDWMAGVDLQLDGLILDWENKMQDDDKTLYSLGLRRARDIVHGTDTLGAP